MAGKKEPPSHFYMCRAQHHRNYCNSLTHTLDPYLDIGLKVLALTEAILIENIVPLSKKNCQWFLDFKKESTLFFSTPLVIARHDSAEAIS